MARRKGRATKKRRARKRKTIEQRVSALEKALRPFGPAKPRGRRRIENHSTTSDGHRYLGAYRF